LLTPSGWLARFLAGYTDLTRDAYALDLRQYASWCQQHQVRLFDARRADIECFAREVEANGRARATVTRRLCTITGFYRYAVEEELLDQVDAGEMPVVDVPEPFRLPQRSGQHGGLVADRIGLLAAAQARAGSQAHQRTQEPGLLVARLPTHGHEDGPVTDDPSNGQLTPILGRNP
jgi:integrase/recombinase XerD